MQGRLIREQLHNGKQVYGMQVALIEDGRAAEALAQVDSDYVFLCAEHHPLDRGKMSMLCQFYRSNNVSPIVRITHPSSHEAAMALDGGADGIVAPYVETVEQARMVVGAVRYRPLKGKLLAKLLSGAEMPNEKTLRYLEQLNRDKYVILGVESVPAYENLDNLVAVDGVDGIFIGPHDLSVSMQKPEEWNDPEYVHTIEDIIMRCRAAGVGVGVHMYEGIFSPERICHFVDLGMNFFLYSSDLLEGRRALRAEFERVRKHVDEMRISESVSSEGKDVSAAVQKGT